MRLIEIGLVNILIPSLRFFHLKLNLRLRMSSLRCRLDDGDIRFANCSLLVLNQCPNVLHLLLIKRWIRLLLLINRLVQKQKLLICRELPLMACNQLLLLTLIFVRLFKLLIWL